MTENPTMQNGIVQIGRRAFLQSGTLLLTPTAFGVRKVGADDSVASLKIALLTDLHHADKPPAGTRHYRETLSKLAEAADQFGEQHVAMLVELGDLIDAADSVDTERRYLKTVNQRVAAICDDRHYVLGNHCVDTLYKEEFLAEVGQEKSYYSFDRGPLHFVVLDACFRGDGQPYGRKNFTWTDTNVPESELEWLQADLTSTQRHTVVFAHQRLDTNDNHGVKNNGAVRRILESAGNVLAVFQGHSHHNDLKEIGGIHYCTLAAMIEGSGAENNGYSLLEIDASGTLRLTGFRRQTSHHWPV